MGGRCQQTGVKRQEYVPGDLKLIFFAGGGGLFLRFGGMVEGSGLEG